MIQQRTHTEIVIVRKEKGEKIKQMYSKLVLDNNIDYLICTTEFIIITNNNYHNFKEKIFYKFNKYNVKIYCFILSSSTGLQRL